MESFATLLERAAYLCSLGYWFGVLRPGGGYSSYVARTAEREEGERASPGKGGVSPDIDQDRAGGDRWSALAQKEVGRRILAEADEIERLEREFLERFRRPQG